MEAAEEVYGVEKGTPREMYKSGTAITEQFCEWTGLKIKHAKSGVFAMDYKKESKWNRMSFKAQGTQIPKVSSYKYLGIELSPMLDWKEVWEIWDRKVRQKLEVIDGLAVDLLVKVQLVQWIVVPIVKYGMEVVDYTKLGLHKWDKLIQSYVRKWAGRSTLSTNIIHARRDEGLGVQSLVDLDVATKGANLVGRLMSKRLCTRDIMESTMVQEMCSAKKPMWAKNILQWEVVSMAEVEKRTEVMAAVNKVADERVIQLEIPEREVLYMQYGDGRGRIFAVRGVHGVLPQRMCSAQEPGSK